MHTFSSELWPQRTRESTGVKDALQTWSRDIKSSIARSKARAKMRPEECLGSSWHSQGDGGSGTLLQTLGLAKGMSDLGLRRCSVERGQNTVWVKIWFTEGKSKRKAGSR
jgi:hypothetical protein